MTSPDERWASIPGYEGRYVISDAGVVCSLERVVHRSDGRTQRFPGAVISQYIDNMGYPALRLSLNGKARVARVHRLLGLTFLPRPPGATVVRHLNDVKTDLRLSNLAWGTRRDNALDIIRNGNHNLANRTHCKRGHEFTAETTRITKSGARDCCACARRNEKCPICGREMRARSIRRHTERLHPRGEHK